MTDRPLHVNRLRHRSRGAFAFIGHCPFPVTTLTSILSLRLWETGVTRRGDPRLVVFAIRL